MGRIYSKAQRVLIWLGDEIADLPYLAPLLQLASESIQKEQTFDHFSLEVQPLLTEGTIDCGQASIQVLPLPWFSRAWVIQKSVLPRAATCLLGSIAFDINALWSVVRKARNIEDRKERGKEEHCGIRQ
ncbi:hypothetical protein BKA63DRAFT_496646 [Paraphoma chrysanthemicola]|nr:hypothetical protein BKA63DRAFT_496646 [Paraphoma chrysanthemicola]